MNMKIIDSETTYKAPKSKVVVVNVQGVLCGSLDSNERMDEDDYGDGGFGRV